MLLGLCEGAFPGPVRHLGLIEEPGQVDRVGLIGKGDIRLAKQLGMTD